MTVDTRAYHDLESAAAVLDGRPVHLAIGMFDGVHLGHRAVIDAAVQSARREHGLAAVLTFHPHPSRLFRPDEPVQLIQLPEDRAAHLREAGADLVMMVPFTPELSRIEAEEFLPYLQSRIRGLSTVYVGENWRFGRGRRGDVLLLNHEARRLGVAVVSAPRINHNGEPISSTRIRACLQQGDIRLANTLLGYTYASTGEVTPGRRLGRTIGVPTLNISWAPECQPRLGVYLFKVDQGGTEENGWPGVGNYGVRPTVETAVTEPRVEVHLLDVVSPYTTGDVVRVRWLDFLRPEVRFANLEALQAQIARDLAAARARHGLVPPPG